MASFASSHRPSSSSACDPQNGNCINRLKHLEFLWKNFDREIEEPRLFLEQARMPSKNYINWLICLIASPIILFGWRSAKTSPPSPSEHHFLPRILNTYPVFNPILNPTRHHDATRNTDYVSQIPSSPAAILFLAHGCGRSARSFWDPHSGCPECLGLPEERELVISSLQRQFAVIAISSTTVCWNLKEDLTNVGGILKEWIERRGLERLPVVALGSSTGGWFVSQFAMQFRFDAIVLMVAEARFKGFSLMNSTGRYPPVMFVHMVKDVARAKQIRVDMAAMTASGVPVTEYLVQEAPVLPDFFARRIPYLGNATSGMMVAALNGSLTQERLLKNDARWFDWSEALEEMDLLPNQLRAHVEQELNVAFAFHEFSSIAAPEIFQWFEYHIQARKLEDSASSL